MKQFYGKKSDLMIKIPTSVKKETMLAYYLKDTGFKGGMETGWKRAHQLTTQKEIPIEDIRFMYNWFARHKFTSYPGFKLWKESGSPLTKEWYNKRSIIAWIIWGGDSGFNWINSNSVRKLLEKKFNKSFPVL